MWYHICVFPEPGDPNNSTIFPQGNPPPKSVSKERLNETILGRFTSSCQTSRADRTSILEEVTLSRELLVLVNSWITLGEISVERIYKTCLWAEKCWIQIVLKVTIGPFKWVKRIKIVRS